MPTPDYALVDRATQAASAVAHRSGIRNFTPLVLDGYSNTLVRLAPHPIVARVATLSSAVRQCEQSMTREIAVGLALARKGAASARPSHLLPPGPHQEKGVWLSFWTYVDVKPERATPAEAGQQLHALHETLSQLRVELSCLSPFYEGQAIVASHLGHRLDLEARRLVETQFKDVRQRIEAVCAVCRPLHGDAHYGNLMRTDEGLIWGDFEDTCCGPIEWDIACLTASSRVFGRGQAASEALAGYGGPYSAAKLDLLIKARVLQAIAWGLVALPDPARDPRLIARLTWLRGHC